MTETPVKPWVMLPKGELHSWGVDYLRVTSKTDAGKAAILKTWAKKRLSLELLGDAVKKGGMQGFTGESVGPLFYGRKDDMFMLQASGSLADELFLVLPWAELHCTRIDLQVTMRYDEDPGGLMGGIGRERAAGFTRHKREPKPRQGLHVGYGRGDTLTIGSRSSPRYGRIYDKWRESKDIRYGGCVRYEIEYKDLMGDKIVAFLLQEQSLDHAIAGAVTGQLADWGIHLETPATPRLVPGSIGRREYDSERALGWLATQVRPTIERLLASVDDYTIYEALGLIDADSASVRASLAAAPSSSPMGRWRDEPTLQGSAKPTQS